MARIYSNLRVMDIEIRETTATIFTSRCELLKNPSILNIVLSIIIFLGILVSYLPQHLRIMMRRTSEGISPFFILLGMTSSTCTFGNVLTQPASLSDVACCKHVKSLECFSGLLGIAQVAIQWLSFGLIFLLFLIFCPRNAKSTLGDANTTYTWRTAITVGYICLLHGIFVLIISIILLMFCPSYLQTWTNLLGILGAALSATQYFPQIWTTWNLGHVGSLSIPMMLIQTPGSFAWSGSLFVRLGVEGWSTWGVYLVTGSLQGCLLVLGIYFKWRQWKNGLGLDNERVQIDCSESNHQDTIVDHELPDPNVTDPLLGENTKNSLKAYGSLSD